jgi:hypothetical protein
MEERTRCYYFILPTTQDDGHLSINIFLVQFSIQYFAILARAKYCLDN